MTSTWNSLDAEAHAVFCKTEQQAPDICILLHQAISTLADGFTVAELKRSDATDAQMGLFSQNLNSLKCSIDLAKRGYYTQSTCLLRGVYENWIAFHYLEQFPQEANLWLQPDKEPPKHRVMLANLGSSFTEDKNDARNWYGALCRFAHTGALVVLPHLGSRDGEACAFFGSEYKLDLFHTCAYTILLFTSIMLREISKAIVPHHEWQHLCHKIEKTIIKFIDQENDSLKALKKL